MSLSQTEIMAFKVSDLKAQLLSRNLSSLGVKAKLQKRLLESVASETPAATTGMEDGATDKNEGTVDESVRYKGTVWKYEYRRGFGLITPEGESEKSKNKVYVHWRQIQSADDWPALTKGMEVEYYLGERKKLIKRGDKLIEKGTQKFAANVTLTGGGAVAISQDELKKNFPDRSQRFSGTVKFFHARKGYGFIKPSTDISFSGENFKAGEPKIYVAREDIKTTENTAPSLKDDLEVEFTLYKRENAKQWGAGDVTLPGGQPVTEDNFGVMGPKPRNWGNKGRKGGFGPFKMKGMPKGMVAVPMGGMGGMPMMNMMNPMMMGGGGGGMMMPMNMMSMMMGGGGGKKKWGGKKNWKKKNTSFTW